MSKENVVLRDPKNNRRKNADGYRTDSGCFEDVDLLMANQNSPTSTSSVSVIAQNDDVTVDQNVEDPKLIVENGNASPIPTSLVDECADDKDFHAILKRLSDITSNSGDLYRLCYNPRLSFCGHMSNHNENDESFCRTGEIDKNDTRVGEQSNGCANGEIRDEPPLEDGMKCTKGESHGQQCVELLSLLSSFMVKAEEDPSMLNHSTLGSSLVAQLSSLLSTLEGAKNNENESIKAQQPNAHNSLQPKPVLASPDHDCNALCTLKLAEYLTPSFSQHSSAAHGKIDSTLGNSSDHDHPTSPLNQRNNSESIKQIKTNDLLLNKSEGHSKQLSSLSQIDQLETQRVVTNSNTHTEMNDNTTLKDLLETQSNLLLPLTDVEPKPTLSPSCPKARLGLNSDLQVGSSSKHSLDNQNEKPLLHQEDDIMPFSTFVTATKMDSPDPTIQHPSDKHDECSSIINHIEDGDANSELNDVSAKTSTSALVDAGDVVTNGRRAVKPYSWDYGDIWEEELERAKNSESVESDGKAGYSPSKNFTDMMPFFEEIRDDLFQNAGFLTDNNGRHANSKHRSRSADARSNLQDESAWPENLYAHNNLHSPFVRTIHQDESRPSSGLTRSLSSHHIGCNSVTVNVDWSHGRQMRVITESAHEGFDNVRAQIIKDAVVRTSTFRGPKPWSVLKRRPSGLRRRSTRKESIRSNKSDESRGKTDNDSESSDSPYISATSSDCLTLTTDDSSSVTSSQNYAASSLPSSPSVSNRSSACFSDTSTSDASDIRRVVNQRPSSEPAFRQHHTWKYDVPTTRGMTLDQRFGFIEKHNRVFLNHRIRNDSTKNCKITFPGEDLTNKDFKYMQGQSSTIPRKWQGDRLISPLFARSDPDLNRLTKVQFVGDSYSRSRISKNVRYTRNRSQSPSSHGPPSAHTRVVSCEIVHSDDRKRDVYTKVNICESLKDEEAMKIHVSQNAKLGYPSTRQSWHGQSPTRVLSRPYPTNNVITPDASFRHSFSCRSKHQQKQIFLSQKETQVEKPVHAKLVAVNNHERMRGHWSTGSFRLPASGRPRLLSDTVVMNDRDHGYSSMNYNVNKDFQNNFNGNSRGNVAGRAQGTDVRTGAERRRSPPDYLTAIKRSKAEKRLSKPNQDERFLTGRIPPAERSRFHTKPKEVMSHIVKETSFVGPSIFTKYQPSPNPHLAHPRRSRSLNEKDTMSRRRLIHDSAIYTRRAINSNDNEGKNLNHLSRCDPNATAVHSSERRRRYSEGATHRATRHDVSSSHGIVDVSYCDPRRESIREGAYSIVNAESARDGAKSDGSQLPIQIKSRGHYPLTIDWSGEKTKLQNGPEMEMPQTQATKTTVQHEKRNKKSSPNNLLQETDENVQEYTHAGFTQKAMDNNQTLETLALKQPRFGKGVSTSVPQNANICEVNRVLEVKDFVDKNEQQKKSLESENKPMRHMKSIENSQINSVEENKSSDLPYQETDEENMEVVLGAKSAYRNITESQEVISPNEKISSARTVVPSVSRIPDESYSTVLTEQLNFNDASKIGLPLLTRDMDDKTEVVCDVTGEVSFTTELQQEKNRTNVGIHLKCKTNNSFSQQKEFSLKQVEKIDEISHNELIAEKRSFIPANGVPSSVKTNSNTVDLNEKVPNEEEDESNIIPSSVLLNRLANNKSNEVNVVIDYRNKRPVSVEYSEEDMSFLRALGSSARSARRDKHKSVERGVKTERKNESCTILDGDVSNRPELIVTNQEDVTYSRLSRKDRHEQEVLTNRVKNRQSERYQNTQVSNHQPSPEPYRRDSTIIFTDARTSFGSDTDSVSRVSTVSSSGSDMTAILQEEMDISVDDLKQLTESGSKIGMEIAAIHVENSNELLHEPDNTPDELPPAMELSKTFTPHQKRVPNDVQRNPELAITNEASNLKENATYYTRKDNTLKRLTDSKNNESLSANNSLSSSYDIKSSCSSIASSHASSKSTGKESYKGKNSSKNGGKGFLSKLKGFRNSFRVKKSEGISIEKKEKIKVCESLCDGNNELSRRIPSNTDANANVLPKSRNRAKSETRVAQTRGIQTISRRSYDAFRHPSNNLRNVVGLKSVSSEHLSAYRINSTPNMNAIAARSLDVLAETCI